MNVCSIIRKILFKIFFKDPLPAPISSKLNFLLENFSIKDFKIITLSSSKNLNVGSKDHQFFDIIFQNF